MLDRERQTRHVLGVKRRVQRVKLQEMTSIGCLWKAGRRVYLQHSNVRTEKNEAELKVLTGAKTGPNTGLHVRVYLSMFEDLSIKATKQKTRFILFLLACE